MNIGVGVTRITPPVGIELAGFGARVQPAVGVHDDLFARAIFLEAGAERLLWLHCDLIGLERDWVRALRASLCRNLDLKPRQVLASATHTHSGPATQSIRGCGAVDPDYMAWLGARLEEAARQASDATEKATLRFAEGRCELGRDRTLAGTPLAHTDPLLPVLAFARPDGTFAAVVANCTVHNVAAGHGNRLVSADMAGVAARHVAQALPGNPVALITNGACGNVDPPALAPDLSLAERYGREIGAAVADLATASSPFPGAELSARLRTVKLPLHIPTEEVVEEEYKRDTDPNPDSWNNGQMLSWRNETLARLRAGSVPDHVETDLQVVRIGPATFAAMGAEVFSRMAEDLRARVGERTYVLGYANGCLGYLPFREASGKARYESGYAYKLYGSFNVAPGAFELLRDQTVELAMLQPELDFPVERFGESPGWVF